jgi:hypothetical protein
MDLTRRLVTVALFSALASSGIYLVSCSSDSSDGAKEGELADVVYEGEVTDEALEEMLGAAPEDWPWKGGVMDSPSDGGVIPATPIATFVWHTDVSHVEDGGTEGGASLLPMPKQVRPGSWLDGLIGPERAAFAHGAPYNGTAFFLVFSTPSDPKLLRVFTGETSYTPDEKAWAKLIGAKTQIKLEISSAIFENNLLASDGGPYKGTPITFTIQE